MSEPTAGPTSAQTPGDLAIELLLAIRLGQPDRADRVERDLGSLRESELSGGLPDESARTSFWVNLYNSAVLRRPPTGTMDSWRARSAFLRRPIATVAGRRLSPDAIEHGILRRSAWRLGLGFAHNPLPSAFERRHRVDRVDPRIHFALNCAAASCPPIAAYEAADLDSQLDIATRAYLSDSVRESDGRLLVPRIFLWYLGDFGGPRGIRRFLQTYDVDTEQRPIRFAPYDWTPMPARWMGDTDGDEPS